MRKLLLIIGALVVPVVLAVPSLAASAVTIHKVEISNTTRSFATFGCETINAETYEPSCPPPPPVQLESLKVSVPLPTTVKVSGLVNMKTQSRFIAMRMRVFVSVDGTSIRGTSASLNYRKLREVPVARTTRLSAGEHTIALSVRGIDTGQNGVSGLLVERSRLGVTTG